MDLLVVPIVGAATKRGPDSTASTDVTTAVGGDDAAADDPCRAVQTSSAGASGRGWEF